MKFTVRAMLFYSASLLIAFVVCGIANALIYTITTYYGFNDFGFAWMFWLGLAMVETGSCVYAVGSISEDILWPIEDIRAEPTEIAKEEGT